MEYVSYTDGKIPSVKLLNLVVCDIESVEHIACTAYIQVEELA
jgi:hypothetical protein